MITNKDITVIIPVHEWNDAVKSLLTEAIKSVPEESHIIITCSKDALDGLKKEKKLIDGKETIQVDDNTSFQHMVNVGVKEVQTDWFSVLEFDDEYSPIWFKNFIKYQEYNQQYNIFFPLVDLYNVEDGKDEFVGNGNESVWASSFSQEIGVIDEKSLDDYFDFYPTGAIFKTEVWNNIGGLKESMKLTFWYEFMLRAAHKGEKIFVIPKVGYIHVLGRVDSLMMKYREEIDVKESEFWFKLAKKESFFKEDRNKTYNPKNESEEDNDFSED